MDIRTRKLTFIQKFARLQNDKYITQLEQILKKALEDEHNFTPMSLNDLNKRIDKSLVNSKNNELIKNEDLLNEIEEWN